MRNPSEVSVVVVTRGIRNHIKLCLDSIKNQTCPVSGIIAIDNSFNASFSEQTSNFYPEVKLYRSSTNLFYSAALNLGIGMSKEKLILCLNDDVVLHERFVEKALCGFSRDSKIGMVSGKILRSDGKTLDSTGLFLSLWRTARERGYGVKDEGQFEKDEYIYGVTGAVAFYRREMLESIKVGSTYFDTDYHIFYEDLDIAWRGHNLGWKAYYVPSAIAYHVRGATVRKSRGIDKPYARRYLNNDLHLDLVKNRYLTLIKNESLLDFLLHLPFILFYDFLLWSYILFFRPVLIKNFIFNLYYLKSAFKKRKSIRRIKFNLR